MVEAEKGLKPQRISELSWTTRDLLPEVNPKFTEASALANVQNTKNSAANRIRPAMRVSWIRRLAEKTPIVLSALHINETSLLHLPAESFLEYQLRAQAAAPERFVATAAYGDGGPWYIPTKEAFPQGGYEVRVANCAAETDDLLSAKVRELLTKR